ncbi:Lupus La protein [Nosema bombycis CQ1]|uniref:Lupus La protein n=1 Tax=Nosema bombycis (strain CQ1 / CVCC 102059) TaxID=578461 RepID=R0MHE6_NOSB1|nr:Lupus La protein [Nosema bombycis CQ1]|eukprot:EOB12223.1 Lupus La protein [Nosema bombycis CQ1]
MTNEKIKKQVEFYFSDANFRVDAFLKQQALLHNDFVPIETILTFKRMKELGATLENVKESLKDSKIVEIKENNIKKIDTEEFKNYLTQKNIDSNFIYISGFDKENTLEDIENILSPFMKFKLVRMRRGKDKKFSGSVFVELENEKEVEDVCKLEIPAKEGPEGGETKRVKEETEFLKIMKKTDYQKEKEKIDEEKNNKEAKEKLLKDFQDKLYKFEITGKDVEIHEIKKLVEDTAFVDKTKKVVRLKFKREFKEKECKNDETTLKLIKMNEDEVKEYCENITVKSKKQPKGDKKKGKKNNKKE